MNEEEDPLEKARGAMGAARDLLLHLDDELDGRHRSVADADRVHDLLLGAQVNAAIAQAQALRDLVDALEPLSRMNLFAKAVQ